MVTEERRGFVAFGPRWRLIRRVVMYKVWVIAGLAVGVAAIGVGCETPGPQHGVEPGIEMEGPPPDATDPREQPMQPQPQPRDPGVGQPQPGAPGMDQPMPQLDQPTPGEEPEGIEEPEGGELLPPAEEQPGLPE